MVSLVVTLALAGCGGGDPDVTFERYEPRPAGAAAGALPAGHGPGDGHDHGAGAGPATPIPTHGDAGGAPPALPAGHPPVAPGAAPGAAPAVETDGHAELPLKKTGMNSRAELDRALAAARSDDVRRAFEEAFRYAFTSDQSRRHYAMAESGFRKAIDLQPDYAEAYRGLAYAVFNRGMRFADATTHYRKAVELKPDYGEAHYALAFLFASQDPAKGREHFRRAMELGVPDERQLGAKFYPDVK